MRRNRGLEGLRADGLQQPEIGGLQQAADVDRHQEIGGRTRAFGLEPLQELVRSRLHNVDADSGVLLKGFEEPFIGLVMAVGVYVYDT